MDGHWSCRQGHQGSGLELSLGGSKNEMERRGGNGTHHRKARVRGQSCSSQFD